MGADLIISHHPLIFRALKELRPNGPGEKALLLAEKGISAICMHTNLDIAEGGVNDVLIRLLGAEPEEALDADGCGRVGTLPEEMPLSEFLALCKEACRPTGFAMWTAAGRFTALPSWAAPAEMPFADAVEKGCDTYVTADVKYHSFLDAAELGLNLIDADHFCTENPVIPILANRLRGAFPDVEFAVSKVHHQVISFF